jgi:dihydroflavonol-4-reductase
MAAGGRDARPPPIELPRLGEKRRFSSAKAQELLGWRPRPLEETILDCARSLIAIGAV